MRRKARESLSSNFSCKNCERGAKNIQGCCRGTVSLPACPHFLPFLSPSLRKIFQVFKVTNTINCLILKKKFVFDNVLPVKENRDDRRQSTIGRPERKSSAVDVRPSLNLLNHS